MISRLRATHALSMSRRKIVSCAGRARLFVCAFATACAVPLTVASPTPATAGSTATDYPRLEAQVLAALNRARANPSGTAADLDLLIRYYNGTLLQRPDQPVPVQTVEGISAVREAATAVRSQSPLPAL